MGSLRIPYLILFLLLNVTEKCDLRRQQTLSRQPQHYCVGQNFLSCHKARIRKTILRIKQGIVEVLDLHAFGLEILHILLEFRGHFDGFGLGVFFPEGLEFSEVLSNAELVALGFGEEHRQI